MYVYPLYTQSVSESFFRTELTNPVNCDTKSKNSHVHTKQICIYVGL